MTSQFFNRRFFWLLVFKFNFSNNFVPIQFFLSYSFLGSKKSSPSTSFRCSLVGRMQRTFGKPCRGSLRLAGSTQRVLPPTDQLLFSQRKYRKKFNSTIVRKLIWIKLSGFLFHANRSMNWELWGYLATSFTHRMCASQFTVKVSL